MQLSPQSTQLPFASPSCSIADLATIASLYWQEASTGDKMECSRNLDGYAIGRLRGGWFSAAGVPLFSFGGNLRPWALRLLGRGMSKPGATVSGRPVAGPDGALTPAEVLLRAFNELRERLLSTLMFLLGNAEDAQDAAQEAFLKCWRAQDKLPEIQNLSAWIFRVCLNTARDLRRSTWRRRARPLGKESIMQSSPDGPPVQMLEYQETLERLRKAIFELRPAEKEVFLLRQNGDLTYEQIAEIRNSPVGTVKTQMRSALQKLRKVLM